MKSEQIDNMMRGDLLNSLYNTLEWKVSMSVSQKLKVQIVNKIIGPGTLPVRYLLMDELSQEFDNLDPA